MKIKTDSNTLLFGLIGHPVALSKSPDIHSVSFERNGINGAYVTFDVEEGRLGEAVNGLRALGAKGFNITIPYKEAVIPHLDEVRGEAVHMNSVNTVKIEDGKLIGYNTDGRGFLASLGESGVDIRGMRVVIIGAGGASRGISHAMAATGLPGEIVVLNRSEDKAKLLCQELKEAYDNGVIYSHASLEWISPSNRSELDLAGLVVNTTSIGMTPDENETPCEPALFPPSTVFADIVYKPHETLFLRQAAEMGARTVHGIDMLIYQALLAEEIWLDMPIDLKETRSEILKIM